MVSDGATEDSRLRTTLTEPDRRGQRLTSGGPPQHSGRMGAHELDRDGQDEGRGLDGLDDLAASARAELVAEIDASGAWTGDPVWREAFLVVPRHLFVPYYYVGVMDGYERRWSESPDARGRERWLRGVYADTPLATRLHDGELVSSSSQPSLMALMLAELEVADGDRVLEIGTGTGYNAALLAHRLGDDDLVTTVDLEPEITEAARRHLAVAGFRPVVVTGDGAGGVPERAPFDRIIATCTLRSIPPAWLAQCRPGARVLAPLATGLIALTVRDAGQAEGRFLHTPCLLYTAGAGPAGRGAAPGQGPRTVPVPARSDPLRPRPAGGVRAVGARGAAAARSLRHHGQRRT